MSREFAKNQQGHETFYIGWNEDEKIAYMATANHSTDGEKHWEIIKQYPYWKMGAIEHLDPVEAFLTAKQQAILEEYEDDYEFDEEE